MLRRIRSRSTLLLRLLMLAAVGLGVFGSSLASALSDIHELTHVEHAVTATAQADEGEKYDEGHADALLHALVHCGHCHGHGGVLPLGSSSWALAAPSAVAVPQALSTQLLSQPPGSVLRPPIAV